MNVESFFFFVPFISIDLHAIMPKKRKQPPPGSRPAPALELLQCYSELSIPVKNGHILFAYLTQGRSYTAAATSLREQVDVIDAGRVQTLVEASLKKFKNLTRPVHKQQLIDFAANQYEPAAKSSRVDPLPPATPSTSRVPLTSTPEIQVTPLHSGLMTPRKVIMHERSKHLSLSRKQLLVRQREERKAWKALLAKKTAPKYVAQQNNRLTATVKKLKEKIHSHF